MQILFESELMENNKQAVVMAPDLTFQVLQTSDGQSLFFSIGTDGIFYVTQEVASTNTGWSKVDLSSALSLQYGGATVMAKNFDVSQNAATGDIDLALAITVNGADDLYISTGNANTSSAFASGVSWGSAIAYDDTNDPVSTLTIVDLYVLQTPNGEFFVVDILKPGSQNLIWRYYITPSTTQHWNPHTLANDLDADTISSCLGMRQGDYGVAGIYTFGSINDVQELLYTQLYNPFGHGTAPNPVSLTVPTGASAIAAAMNSSGESNLFVVGDTSLYLFTPDNQKNNATSICIVTNDILTGVGKGSLCASTNSVNTAVWGVNGQGELFYFQCAAGSEAIASAWSNPVPLLTDVEDFAFFLNLNAGNNVLFAQVSGSDGSTLVQLTQDPATTVWQQRSILLPPTSVDDLITFDSFTTQITITDANNVPAGNSTVLLTATSPVSVYVNDVYQVLLTDTSPPFQTNTDVTGVLTIVQETDSLGAVCYNVQLPTGESASVNPMANLLATLGNVGTDNPLSGVTVTNSDGSTYNLFANVSSDQQSATTQAIQQFVKVANTLPTDGTINTSPLPALSFSVVGLSSTDWTLPDLTPISVAAGDLFSWAKSAYDDVAGFLIQAGETAYDFLVQIGDDLYHVTLDCLRHVAHAVELVFNKIGLFLDDLIPWLGFLFEWSDILNTHAVIKTIFTLYASRAGEKIKGAEEDVKRYLGHVEKKVDDWANLPDNSTTMGSYLSQQSSVPGQNSPQASWALHHLKSNVSSMNASYTPPSVDISPFKDILHDLKSMISNEATAFKAAYENLKTQVVEPLDSLTPTQIGESLVAIVVKLLLDSGENILLTGLNFLSQVAADILGMLTAPISIPVLTPMYSTITQGDGLTVLDLVCLVVAIPATVVYKDVTSEAPFNETFKTAITQATDWASLQNVVNGTTATAAQGFSLSTTRAAATRAVLPQSWLTPVTVIADIVALFGTSVVILCSGLKQFCETANVPEKLAIGVPWVSFASYLPYVAPDIAGALGNTDATWYTIMNDIVTGIAVFKTGIDNVVWGAPDCASWAEYVSPFFEAVINATWIAPAVAALAYTKVESSGPQPSDWLSFLSNLSFDMGGVISPATSPKLLQKFYELTQPEDPELAPEEAAAIANVEFGVVCALNYGYGLLGLASGIALTQNN